MRLAYTLSLLGGAFGALLVPSAVGAASTGKSLHSFTAATVRASARSDALIPAWTRKYNMNCSGCHYPAPPRLNGVGIRYRWAGYRMPEEMGEKVDVAQLANYVSVRGRMRYDYNKTENQPVSSSAFQFNDVTLFYGGPLGKNFATFLELEREPSGEVGLVSNILGVWGKEKAYGGFRVGQMHWLLRDGVAGFERPTGIRTPIPVGNPITTGGVPFRFSNDQLGAEGFYVAGRNRLSAEILNGIRPNGSGEPPDPDPEKDFVVSDQFLFDDRGSGLTAVGYYGTVKGLNALVAPTLRSHFSRFAVSANKIINRFEILGAFVYGKDQDLPGGAVDVTGQGYWVSGQYMLPNSSFTLFGRYEFVDPNTDVSNNGTTRFVAGFVLPVNRPEYFRVAVEGSLDSPQASTAPKRTGLTAELMINF